MHHQLDLSPATTVVGAVDRSDPAALWVESGDLVSFQTGSIGGDRVTASTTLEELAELLTARAPEAGGHTLTGPIGVRGAKPGDVLRVDILQLSLREHAYNFQLPGHLGKGLLPEDFPHGRIAHYRNDLADMTVEVCAGVRVPLRPFLGFVAVAPESHGPHHSVPPGDHGGNMDLPQVCEGSSVYLPVFVDGGLLYLGDAHSTQGYGEVCLSALETAFEHAEIRVELLEGLHLRRPRVETPESWITLGFDPDLVCASKVAVREMIDLLSTTYGIDRADAYTLCSATVDLAITQIVNGTRGVHASLPKSIFAAEIRER